MTEIPIRVDRATDADRFLATDQTVWFQEVYPAPAEQQLVGFPRTSGSLRTLTVPTRRPTRASTASSRCASPFPAPTRESATFPAPPSAGWVSTRTIAAAGSSRR